MSDDDNKIPAGEVAQQGAETKAPKSDNGGAQPKAKARPDEAPDFDDLVDALRAENNELKDRYVRLAADMENLRKRTEREKADMAKYAISGFAGDIVKLSDNFQRAISVVSPEAVARDDTLKSFLEGVEMNERELQKVLERHGVLKIDPKGEKFDPNFHQAVTQVDNPELPHGTVCDVYQVGYMISDRVLRSAMVAVAKGGPRLAPPEPAADEQPQGSKIPADSSASDESAAETGSEQASEKDEMGSTVDKNI